MNCMKTLAPCAAAVCALPLLLNVSADNTIISSDDHNAPHAQPMMTDQIFVFRGDLWYHDQPVHGAVDLEFRFFADEVGETQVGSTILAEGWEVIDGRIAIAFEIDEPHFVMNGGWVEVTVDGVTLTPRRFVPPPGLMMIDRGVDWFDADEAAMLGLEADLRGGDPEPRGLAGHGDRLGAWRHSALGGAAGHDLPVPARSGVPQSERLAVFHDEDDFDDDDDDEEFDDEFGFGAQGLRNSHNPGWQLRGSDIVWTTNRVGIRTKRPSRDLDIRGTARIRQDVWLGGNVSIGLRNAQFPLHVRTRQDNRAIFAHNRVDEGVTSGLFARCDSNSGRGVIGWASSNSGTTHGGWFEADSDNGRGVLGLATALTGFNFGVWGQSDSIQGRGVFGWASAESGNTRGVMGVVNSTQGYAGYFAGGRNYFEGHVGLGVINPTFRLHLSQDSAAKPTSNTWTISSDERLKTNIRTIERALDDLLALRGVTYQWTEPESQGGMEGVYPGLIAQEVEAVFPDWVRDDANGYKTLTVIGFEGIVVEALRELRAEKDAQIRQLEEQLDQRDRLLEDLIERIERLEAAAMR